MADPFLLAHLVRPLFFDIGGALSPVSIRDQMIRGRMIVDRSVEAGLLGTGRSPLLVIGAGAAGATAAIRAAQRGIRTVLIEINPAPFLRQGGCQSRWVNPTQYDWPVGHWTQSRYHWMPPAMPMPWREALANVLAVVWTVQLNSMRRRYGPALLDVRYRTTLGSLALSGSSVQGTLATPTAPSITQTFAMAVSCAGFGTERCTIGSYSGFRFWDTDDFEMPNLGLPASRAGEVLISGGGDGALQDVLRIIAGKPAVYIYNNLTAQSNVASRLAKLEREIQDAEDQAQRAYIWGASPQHDHEIQMALHQAYLRVIQNLQANPQDWSDVCSQLHQILPANIPKVELVYPCEHFDRSYGLNRFLVLLFAEYLQGRRGVTVLRPKTRVAHVSSGTHTHTWRQ